MTRNRSLANIIVMLEVAEIGYSSLLESANASSASITEIPNSRERLTELKRVTENLLKEFVEPLTPEEFEGRNRAVALLNAINSALNSGV